MPQWHASADASGATEQFQQEVYDVMQLPSFRKRGGYTLSEVLLVLGVIAGVAALAQPALRSSLGDSRLRSAARQVRTELAKTRLRAMQSGTAQRFRYQVEHNCFEIVPANFDAEQLAENGEQTASLEPSVAVSTSTVSANPDAGAAPQPPRGPVQQELPAGVLFCQLDESLMALVDEEGWSEPIVFHPNGRAADATIRLRGERGAVVDVSLRGLTGIATASKPRHEKALQ